MHFQTNGISLHVLPFFVEKTKVCKRLSEVKPNLKLSYFT